MYSVRDFKDLCTFNDNTDPLINESNIHSMYYYCYLLFYLPESTDSRYSISHQYYYCYLLFYLPESTVELEHECSYKLYTHNPTEIIFITSTLSYQSGVDFD